MDIRRLEEELVRARERADEALGGHLEESIAAMNAQAEAERALARARGEEHAIPVDLGVVWSGGAPCPHVLAGYRTFVAFYLQEDDPNWDGSYVTIVDPASDEPASLGLLEFEGCGAIKMGPPNDEVLDGHPLYGRGLEHYGAYEVVNSQWKAELERINSVHHMYDPHTPDRSRHFLLVFHDETIDVIADAFKLEAFTMSMPALLAKTAARLDS